MRHPDDGAFQHAGLGVEEGLDLLGVDVVAAGDDQVLVAPDDVDMAVGVDPAQVAGDEEAVGAEFRRRPVRHPPVAQEDVRAAHLDLADLALRQGLAGVGVGDAQRHAGQRRADRAGAPLAVIGVGGVHAGLGHAVALQDGVAGARLEAGVGLGLQRRAAGDEQAHVPHQLPGESRIVEKPGVEGRHAHQGGGPGQLLDQRVQVEALQQDHRGAGGQHRVGGHEQPVGVEDRQRVQQHVRGAEAPAFRQGLGVGEQVVLGQHGAFRPPGGAGGIQQGGQVVSAARRRGKVGGHGPGALSKASGAVGVEGLQMRAVAAGEGGERRLGGGVADQGGGGAVLDEIAGLVRRVGGVQRQEDDARLHARRIQRQRLGRLAHLRGEAVAGPDAEARQRLGEARRRVEEFRMGRDRAVGQDQEGAPLAGVAAEKPVVERVGHGRGPPMPAPWRRPRRASAPRRRRRSRGTRRSARGSATRA